MKSLKLVLIAVKLMCLTLFMLLLPSFLLGLADALLVQSDISWSVYQLLSEALSLVSVLFCSWLLWHREGIRQFTARMGLHGEHKLAELRDGSLLGIVLIFSGAGVLSLAYGCTFSMGIVSAGNLCVQLVLMLLVAFTEEFLVRAYLLGSLCAQGLGVKVAVLISALFFSALHLLNPGVSALSTLNVFFAGVLLGVAYLRHANRLWYCVGFHLCWNFFQGSVLGFSVSGMDMGSVLVPALQAPDYISGGDFGFEGSVFCTLMLVLGTFYLLYIRKPIIENEKSEVNTY